MMASVNDEWRDVGKINSSRDMMPGEKVNAHAFNNNTGEKLDSVELTPQRNQLGVHRWPYYFAMLINESTYMRAGSRETGSAIKPEWSGYKNRLWSKDPNVRVFTTSSDLSNWTVAETLRSVGNLASDGTGGVEVQVQSEKATKPCEKWTFRPGVDRYQQGRWEVDLCQFINQNSAFIRAGEKNIDTNSFECNVGQALNKFWVPVGSLLKVTYKIVVLEKIPTANDWRYICTLDSHRPLLPGENITAYAFKSDTGEELERVRLPVGGDGYDQYRWPHDFAVLINRHAKHMKAGLPDASGAFIPDWASFKNKLWCKEPNTRVFTTIGILNNWVEVERLNSNGIGDLSSDGTAGVEVRVQCENAKQPCEPPLIFRPGVDRHQQFRWEMDLARFINKNSLFIRVGEKNILTYVFDCIGSWDRNKFWVPVGSGLKVSYRIITLEKIPAANDWVEVGKISFNRAVVPGERIIAYAISNDTGEIIERVELPARKEESPKYVWPSNFAQLINKSQHMRAGVRASNGEFKPASSTEVNTLWSKSKNVRLFTTISDLANWVDAGTIESTGDLLPAGQGSVVVQVLSADGKRVYETWTYRPKADRHLRYRWEMDLSLYINQNSSLIRAGEKKNETQSFKCMGSSYLNKLWVPLGSGLKVSYEIIETPVTKPDAALKNGDNDVLPDMSGFESDRLGATNNAWFSPGYLLADRDLNDGEKLYALLISTADGKPVENVEFIAGASNRSKAQWPGAFATVINSKAKQIRAGGWSSDGQFAALETTASAAEFAGKNVAFKAGINRLWHYGDGYRAFTTAAFRTNWVQALTLDNAGLNAIDTFCVQVRDITSQYLYETHLFIPDAKKPLTSKTLCQQINSDGKMLRAGIWNTKTFFIAPDDKNNALWIPQCSDLAVTLMTVRWWSQTTISATRDLQDGESIYCYVLDDFSNAELVPALRFTPKTAADRKKNAWLRTWSAAIKASPLARYVRLGSSASGSSDPGENATQATLWQIGAPLRVFTTEPSPNNWMSAAGPLAELYENNKTAVKIELRNGLTQGLIKAIIFKPSEAVIKVSDKELWLREFYNYLVSQLASLAYVRVGKTVDASGAEITSPVPTPMTMWVPRRSGIVVEVSRASSSTEAVAPVSSKLEVMTVSDFKYASTAQIAEWALVATVIAVGGSRVDAEFLGRLRTILQDVSPKLTGSLDEVIRPKLDPVFELAVKESSGWTDPFNARYYSEAVFNFIAFRRSQLLEGGKWGRQITVLYNDVEVKKYIAAYEVELRSAYDLVFSRHSQWVAEVKESKPSLKTLTPMPMFDELVSGHQLILYGGQSQPLFILSQQAVARKIRVLSICPAPDYLAKVGNSKLNGVPDQKNEAKVAVVIDLYAPDDVVFDESFIVGYIGKVSSDSLWPSGRALKMSLRKNKLVVPDSPLCGDYGNTYRSEVFDVSGQNITGVDPRTGLFNAHYPLAVLMGMEGKGPLCDLTLRYSALRANEAGLGDGWAFNFSSYESRSRLITLSTGQTIELTAADITKLRNKTAVVNRNCRISATCGAISDSKSSDGIETLTLEFPSGAIEVLSLPAGDKVEPYAETVKIVIARLNEAKAQIFKVKDQDKPERTSAAGLVGEVFSWVLLPVGIGITANNSVRYMQAKKEWESRWAEKLPDLVGSIDTEIAYWQRESRQLLPSTITSAAGGSLQMEWERRKGQFLLTKVSSSGKTLLTGSYKSLADAGGNKVNEVTFSVWPGTDEAYDVKLQLQNYLLKTIVRSEKSAGTLQTVRYGYSGDPTLDRVLTSIEESDGSLEVVFYDRAAMIFPSGVMDKPPLPRVTRHIVQPGVGQTSLITQWAYSGNNYLGANSRQSFSRLDDGAVKEGAKYRYDSTATETGGVAITRTWNGLHLQVKEQETAPSGVGKTTEWNFASVDPTSPLFGLVTSINTTYQESEPAKESTK